MFLSSLLATTWYPVTFNSQMNIVRGVFFWIAVALAIGFLLGVILSRNEARRKFLKFSLYAAIVYAGVVGIVLLDLTFAEDGTAQLLFIPLLVLLLTVVGCGALIAAHRSKVTYVIAGCLVGAALIAVLVCMGVHFANGGSLWLNWILDDAEENPDPSKVNQIGLYISAALAVIALVTAAFLLERKDKKGLASKDITYAAICIAMSFALSYLRIVKMPQGGSITVASLLPLMIYSYMFGVKKGVFAGFIYGVLQAFQDLYILHPAQFILDYPAAFACIGLAGVFANVKSLKKLPQVQIALGGIIAGVARFVMHFLSGMFAFGMWAPEGQPVWLYSLTYQSAYVLPDIAICIVIAILVFSSKAFVKQARKFNVPAPVAKAPLVEEAAPASSEEQIASEPVPQSNDKTE